MTNRISLSQWLGVIDIKGMQGGERRPSQRGSFVKGPLTVFEPDRGAEIISFGPTGSSALLFEGYLVDKPILAGELREPNEEATAQLAVAAYNRWGTNMFDHLEGRYLIAVWDDTNRRCLIGHDGLGKHPVYYATDGGQLHFASNIFSVAYSGAVTRRPNRLALAWRLLGSWPPPGETFFEKIRRVRPGHYLEITPGGLIEKQYWEPFPEDHEPWLPEKSVLEEFEPRLERCVQRYMELRPEGVLLSGGVDSVTIAAIAQDHAQKAGRSPLVACCGQSPPGFSTTHEQTLQNQVVQDLEMPQLIWNDDRYMDGGFMLRDTIGQVPRWPSPTDFVGTSSYTAFWRKVSASGIHTLLTGSGGDEWLSVHYAYAADLARRGALLEIHRFAVAEVFSGDNRPLIAIFLALLWRRGMRLVLASWWKKLAPLSKNAYSDHNAKRGIPNWLCPDPALRANLLENMATRRMPELTKSGALPQSYYFHSLRFLWQNPLMAQEFETEHHIASSIGVQLIHPYHDRMLVEFLYRVPPRLLMQGDRYKGLLRAVASARCPGLGFEDVKKISAGAAEHHSAVQGFRQDLAEIWHNTKHQRLHELGIVDMNAINPLFENARHLSFRPLYLLFNTLSAETWLAAHC